MTDQTTTQAAGSDNSASGADDTKIDATTQAAAVDQVTQAATIQADATTVDSAKADDASKAWGEQWREDYATKAATVDGKVNEEVQSKILARLKRFPSAKEALDWGFSADKKIADGSYRKPLGDKATAEEIAEYRKSNGIPETPDKYLDSLPDGLVVGDEDKPFIEKFTKAFHDKNADPAVVHAAIATYYKVLDEQEGQRQEANTAAKTLTEDALRTEWGADFRANTNLINAFIGSMPEELQAELFQSAKPDGTQIMNNPEMLKWFAQQARELNYTGAVLPSGQALAKGLETEIHELTAASGDKNGAYWKGPAHPTMKGETVMSGRLLELMQMKERLASRAA